jgi:small multidrug resistance pump
MTQAYWLLAIAILAEVVATSTLKATNGFTRLWPSLAVACGYAVAFYCLSLSMRAGMSIGVAYALWSGIGIVLIATIGIVLYEERLDAAAIAGFALIVAGVMVLNLFSRSVIQP